MQFLVGVGGWLRGLWASLCETIYTLLAWLYELFLNVSRVELLTTESIEPIYQRITMILTIIMVFYVTFEAVKYVVQPDSFSDKEKGGGKLTLKMVLVVILIAFVPSIFTWAYKFQNVIFDNQIFSKVILGKEGIDTKVFGRVFSSNVLSMFYYADEPTWGEVVLEEEDNCEGIPCKTIVNANLSSLVEYGELTLLTVGITSGDTNTEEGTGDVFKYYIHFDGIFAVVVGLFVCYMLVLYSVDVGVRLVQLTFLQIIAPIPIIGYLAPKKDGIFQKWVKQCITTYLDLFIRTAIIYFGLFICQILSDAYTTETLFNNLPNDVSDTMKVFIYIALILGVLLFIQKAPKMLGELFPSTGAASGNFGLKLKDRPALARGAGMTIGGALVGAKGLIGNTINRAKRNHHNKDQRKIDKEGLKQSKQNYRQAKRDRRNMNKQIRNGQYMVDDEYTDENGVKKTRKRAATKEEIAAKKRELNENVRDRKIDKESAQASRDNTKYRFEGFSAAAGLVGGVVRGATAGVKATDAKGIVKQVSEGLKNQESAMAKTEKWYDEGGGSYIDRAVASVEKSLGINTASDVIANQIQREEKAIKSNEALITAESNVKKTSDDVESRLESKLNTDSKATVDSKTKAYLESKVAGIVVTDGEKMAELRKKYKSKTETALAKLNTIIKNNGSPEDVAKAETELAKARENEELVNKHTMRAVYTQHLNGTQISDPVVSQKIALMKQSVETARRNVDTISRMKKEVEENRLSETDFQAFMSGNFDDYDQLDNVITRLQTIINTRTIENQQIQETKRRLETSKAYAAAKADKSSSGGK